MKTKKGLPLIIFAVAAAAAVPLVFNPATSYLVTFLFTAFTFVALAESWNLVGGYAGQVSLGHHAFFGFGAYVVAIAWSRHLIGYLDPLGFLAAGCGAAVLAVLVGMPLLSKLRGDYFALGTLGLGEILRISTIRTEPLTGGSTGLLLDASRFTTMTPHYYIALFLAVFAVAVTRYITKSRIGLALIAIREDEAAAEASGVSILGFKVFVFAVGAFIAGLCGGLQAYYLFTVEPQGFYNLNWTIYPVLMCVLGGAGTLSGPVIGAIFLTLLFEAAKFFLPTIHPLFSGLLIILTIVFLPDGLVGLKEVGFLQRRRKRIAKAEALQK